MAPPVLSSVARQELATILDDYIFTCGACLNDLELSPALSEVCVRDMQCYEPVGKLYYSMKYDPICVFCCSADNLVFVDGCYPQCQSYKNTPVKRRVIFTVFWCIYSYYVCAESHILCVQ